MSEYSDGFWTSRDGLRLHYREYSGRADRPAVLCLHGLTRNARDFAGLAERISGERRVLCPEMRGRGGSEYAREMASYNPIQYIEDVNLLLEELEIDRFVAIGTSMGGLMILLMAMSAPDRIAGAVINDIGLTLEPEGVARIREHVGQGGNFPTWVHAARALEETQSMAHPGFELADWIAMAKRTMTLSSNGRILFDYDMKIAEAFMALDFERQPDLSPALDGLAEKPVLVLRGAQSDLFSAQNSSVIMARLSNAEAVTVPEVGHAPLLTEPEAEVAIDRLLAKID
ncbi:MAG: alpha/beta hydrolase [Sphingomonadaceae bacterium]|nr:alpha/beta hydrolase [Sphingomonadaceae bacterium]